MNKKTLIICILVFVVCVGVAGIGALTEKNGSDEVMQSNTPIDETTKSNSDTETTPSVTDVNENQILTVNDCEDLATLLKTDSSEVTRSFVDKHKGQTIEFDGNISYMTKHDDAKTRYDIMLNAGDYNENTSQGPSFKFEDVNTYDLGIKDLYLPEFVATGSNVHIVAKIKDYNEDTGILRLKPISIQAR